MQTTAATIAIGAWGDNHEYNVAKIATYDDLKQWAEDQGAWDNTNFKNADMAEGEEEIELDEDSLSLQTECTVLLQMLADYKPELRKELGLGAAADVVGKVLLLPEAPPLAPLIKASESL